MRVCACLCRPVFVSACICIVYVYCVQTRKQHGWAKSRPIWSQGRLRRWQQMLMGAKNLQTAKGAMIRMWAPRTWIIPLGIACSCWYQPKVCRQLPARDAGCSQRPNLMLCRHVNFKVTLGTHQMSFQRKPGLVDFWSTVIQEQMRCRRFFRHNVEISTVHIKRLWCQREGGRGRKSQKIRHFYILVQQKKWHDISDLREQIVQSNAVMWLLKLRRWCYFVQRYQWHADRQTKFHILRGIYHNLMLLPQIVQNPTFGCKETCPINWIRVWTSTTSTIGAWKKSRKKKIKKTHWTNIACLFRE